MEALYDAEQADLYQYYVEGGPAMLLENFSQGTVGQ